MWTVIVHMPKWSPLDTCDQSQKALYAWSCMKFELCQIRTYKEPHNFHLDSSDITVTSEVGQGHQNWCQRLNLNGLTLQSLKYLLNNVQTLQSCHGLLYVRNIYYLLPCAKKHPTFTHTKSILWMNSPMLVTTLQSLNFSHNFSSAFPTHLWLDIWSRSLNQRSMEVIILQSLKDLTASKNKTKKKNKEKSSILSFPMDDLTTG